MSLRSLSLPLVCLLAGVLFVGCPGGGAKTKTGKKTAKTAKKTAKTKTKAPEKPFDRKALTTPWKDAQVGQFAVYEDLKNKLKLKFKVLKVEDRHVTVARLDKEGKVDRELKLDLADEEEKYKAPKEIPNTQGEVKEQTVKVGGKDVKCMVVVRKSSLGSTENWVTTAVPPFMDTFGNALVSSKKDGEEIVKLVDFGKE